MNFNEKKVLVLGLKKSGRAAIRLLKTLNVEIYVSDEKILEGEINNLFEDVKYVDYKKLINYLKNIDIIVKSPGIKYDVKILKKARKRKIPVISEIELAYHFVSKNKVLIGITGTNGKTTTTSLITEILKDNNVSAYSVGNIGYCLSDSILDNKDADVFVIELSSFQLLDTLYFKPHIAVLLNISNAHINYHNNFKNYINAKMKLIKNMGKSEYLVYNEDDVIIKKRIKRLKSEKRVLSALNKTKYAYYANDTIFYAKKPVIRREELNLLGFHNLYNVMAAINVAKIFDIDSERIAETLRNFNSLPHRIQYIENINQITYYNDSKSTNVESTICALNSMKKPVILILGGLDSNQEFNKIMLHKNVKTVITFGQTKNKISKTAKEFNINYFICNDLKEVVLLTQDIGEDNDVVLFSPGCSSWDQFENYEQRGEYYIKLVNSIVNKNNEY